MCRLLTAPRDESGGLWNDRLAPVSMMRAVVTVGALRASNRLAAVECALLDAPGVLGVDIDLVCGTVAIDYDERVIDERRLRRLLTPKRAEADGGLPPSWSAGF